MYLSFDIIYNIYFYIDDYHTILSFYILNKSFYNYIKNYTKTYTHKWNIAFNDIFSFLSVLPYSTIDDINTLINIEFKYKNTVKKDYFFIYNVYRTLIFNESILRLGSNIGHNLTNIILTQGVNHIDKNTIVIFNKNNIKVEFSKYQRILALNKNIYF